MSTELYQQVDPDEVGMSSAYLGNIDALQERYLAENAYQGSVVLVARHGKRPVRPTDPTARTAVVASAPARTWSRIGSTVLSPCSRNVGEPLAPATSRARGATRCK